MSVEYPSTLGSRRQLTVPAIALGTCAGYYLASIVGFQLRLPPATTSVLWPPNAILTAALLLTAPRYWAVILLSVLPVHLLIQLQTEFPLPLILALFVTNCTEALLAAGGVYWLTDAPSRFDTLRRLRAFFIAAVIAAPLLSSFGDAAAVTWFRGEAYWHVWRTRSLSNILAELTVVPAVVGGVVGVLRWSRGTKRRRYVEAAILGLGLSAIGLLDFSSLLWEVPAIGAVSQQTPLAVQLPFLLWAAMRFGPTGAGLTLLTTSILSAWAVVHGVGPFSSIAPSTTIPALTISLIVVSTTLLCLATLIEERRQAQHALGFRLRFEELLSRLSSALVQLPSDQMTRAFEPWLGRIAGVLGIDSLTVFAAPHGVHLLQSVYTWTDPEAGGPLAISPIDHLTWARRSLLSREAVVVSDDGAHSDATDAAKSTQSVVFKAGGAIPLVGEGELLGALAFASIREPLWSDDLVANTQLLGEVLASALRRRRSEDALRESEVMKSAILQSLSSGVAVLDRTGTLLQVNDRWRHLADGSRWMNAETGSNLMARCWEAFEGGDRLAGDVVAGLASVLEGSRAKFIVEHRTDTEAAAEWWSLTAVPLNRPEGGAVLTRADITDLRRAEMEAQRSRQELAHVSRVSTVGEMTASLAHQLNQPLAAIMTNAQAGTRILDSSRPDMNEVRAILHDIVKDDRRASDVIQRLRELLRKGQLEMTRVNLTSAIREVIDLVSSEAIIRNVAVTLNFEQEPVFVRGDRVQLQQVILNLIHNAMEAMHDSADTVRRINIDCRQGTGQQVLVTVQDSGPGIRPGTEDSIFEPFYTTKASGMGMGLSIVRSILEAHGGDIRAANDSTGGAIFEFFLPTTAGSDT
jgi:C4-dicarboxylate-specific signal transduction histidine kinase/integral membrane sensor domain MASE1